MSTTKRKALGAKIDEALEASNQAIARAADALVQSYYEGIETLRRSGGLDAYVKLNLRARMRGNSVDLSWFNRHTKGGPKGFENISRPRGRHDYNLAILRGHAPDEMKELVDRTEEAARLLREASKKLVEANASLQVMQNRLLALPPSVIAAINTATQAGEALAAKQQYLDLDKL